MWIVLSFKKNEIVKNLLHRNVETIQVTAPIIKDQRPERVTVLVDGENIKEEKELSKKWRKINKEEIKSEK